jgi:hypothetical protein
MWMQALTVHCPRLATCTPTLARVNSCVRGDSGDATATPTVPKTTATNDKDAFILFRRSMNLTDSRVTIGRAYKPCAELKATGFRVFGETKRQKMRGRATPLPTTTMAILINNRSVLCSFLAISFNRLLALLFMHIVFLVLPHHLLQTCLKRGTGGRCLCSAHNFARRWDIAVETPGLYCTTRKNDRCQRECGREVLEEYVRPPDADDMSTPATPRSQQTGIQILPLTCAICKLDLASNCIQHVPESRSPFVNTS